MIDRKIVYKVKQRPTNYLPAWSLHRMSQKLSTVCSHKPRNSLAIRFLNFKEMVDDPQPSTLRDVSCLRNTPEPLLYLYCHSSDEDVDKDKIGDKWSYQRLVVFLGGLLPFFDSKGNKSLLWHTALCFCTALLFYWEYMFFLSYLQISIYKTDSVAMAHSGRNPSLTPMTVIPNMTSTTLMNSYKFLTSYAKCHWHQYDLGTPPLSGRKGRTASWLQSHPGWSLELSQCFKQFFTKKLLWKIVKEMDW